MLQSPRAVLYRQLERVHFHLHGVRVSFHDSEFTDQFRPQLIIGKHPGELKDDQTPSRAFLADKWLYADASAQVHLPVAVSLVADLVGGQPQQFVEEGIIQQYLLCTGRELPLSPAMTTEVDVYLRLGYKMTFFNLWRVFCDYVEEAKEMFAHRDAERLSSYAATPTT